MAYRYEIDPEQKLVMIEVSGVDSAKDVIDRMRKIVDDPQWKPGMAVLVDMTHIESTDVNFKSSQEISEAHRLMEKTIGQSRIAIVAPSDLTFGISRIWKALSEEFAFEVEVFRERAPAHEWVLKLDSAK